MKIRIADKISEAALLFCMLAILPARGSNESTTDCSLQIEECLHNSLTLSLREQEFKGLTVAVSLGGQVVWKESAGIANENGDPLTNDHLLGISSITKTFTAALVLKLAEEEKLSLDDTIGKWLRSFPNIDSTITLRQLLNMTSGINIFHQHPNWYRTMWGRLDRFWKPEEILDSYVGEPLFEPGTWWRYSDTNYILLGMIIESASGTSFEKLLRERILDPLEMTSTYLEKDPKASLTPIAHPFADWNGDRKLEDHIGHLEPSYYSSAWSAWGMFSTSTDLVKWIRIHSEGHAMQSPSRDEMINFIPLKIKNGGRFGITGYGLGMIRISDGEREFIGHTGEGLGYHSLAFHSPDLDITIAIMVNEWPIANKSWAFELYPVFENLVDTMMRHRDVIGKMGEQ